jgi:hypothetical protein
MLNQYIFIMKVGTTQQAITSFQNVSCLEVEIPRFVLTNIYIYYIWCGFHTISLAKSVT